jgi:hypothetical protein
MGTSPITLHDYDLPSYFFYLKTSSSLGRVIANETAN